MIPNNLTGNQYLEYLTPPEAASFVYNVATIGVKGHGDVEHETFAVFVGAAFKWAKSAEGEDYWKRISERKEKQDV